MIEISCLQTLQQLESSSRYLAKFTFEALYHFVIVISLSFMINPFECRVKQVNAAVHHARVMISTVK